MATALGNIARQAHELAALDVARWMPQEEGAAIMAIPKRVRRRQVSDRLLVIVEPRPSPGYTRRKMSPEVRRGFEDLLERLVGPRGDQGQGGEVVPDDLLDAAEDGRVVTVSHGAFRAAIVDAERLRRTLAASLPSHVELVADAGGWTALLPGTPISAVGATAADAIDELVRALREFAHDWQVRQNWAPSDAQHWGLVQYLSLSDDDQVRDWLAGH